MVSTYPSTTDNHTARYPRSDGGLHEPIPRTDEKRLHGEIGEASPWWIRRVQQDAEVLDAFMIGLAEANRGPLALGGISREFRRFADRHKGTERMSRDRLYGALVLLALRGRVHIYGDGSDITANPTFQALTGTVGVHQLE
jgi:hypothetical protein